MTATTMVPLSLKLNFYICQRKLTTETIISYYSCGSLHLCHHHHCWCCRDIHFGRVARSAGPTCRTSYKIITKMQESLTLGNLFNMKRSKRLVEPENNSQASFSRLHALFSLFLNSSCIYIQAQKTIISRRYKGYRWVVKKLS